MKQENNKGKKTLAVVGAVVAAGLTPGIINSSLVPGSNGEITAADVVAMDGTTYSFDELYVMQRGDTVEMQVELPEVQIDAMPQATKYGARIHYPSNDKPTAPESKTVYRSVEQMPQFPGGEAALMKYLKSHINYPPMAAMNDIQGNVIVQFVVNEDGSVGEVKVVRSVDKDLDREAIRVIKSLPKFTPGRHKGKAASVWYTLPVPFKLN